MTNDIREYQNNEISNIVSEKTNRFSHLFLDFDLMKAVTLQDFNWLDCNYVLL